MSGSQAGSLWLHEAQQEALLLLPEEREVVPGLLVVQQRPLEQPQGPLPWRSAL
jgi:hypothetical protein